MSKTRKTRKTQIAPQWWAEQEDGVVRVYDNAESTSTYFASFWGWGDRYTCIHGFADPLAAARQFAASEIMLEAWEEYTNDRGGCAFLRMAQRMGIATRIANGAWEPPEEEQEPPTLAEAGDRLAEAVETSLNAYREARKREEANDG